VDNPSDKDTLTETLLQERDELYQELFGLRQSDGGTLEHYEDLRLEEEVIEPEGIVRKQTKIIMKIYF